MDWLKQRVYNTDPFREILAKISSGGRVVLKNVPGALPVLVADFLREAGNRPILMVAETLEDAEEYADDLTALMDLGSPCLLPGRPQFGRELTPVEQSERAEVLLALETVDAVVVYDADTPLEVVRGLVPDVLVKGADWAHDAIVGRAEVEAGGGRVVRVGLVPGRSSSSIVARIRRP